MAKKPEVYGEWWRNGLHEMHADHEGFGQWLMQQDFETWHNIALGWNWDYGLEVLQWIAMQPECDMGTACFIFFTDAPNFGAYEESSFYSDSLDLSWSILKRWQNNDFSNRKLFPYREAIHWDLDEKKQYIELQEGIKNSDWPVPDYVYEFEGERHSNSDYYCRDGGIWQSFEQWKKNNGY